MIFKKYKFQYDSSINQVINYIALHINTYANAHSIFTSLPNSVENKPNSTYNKKHQYFIIYSTIHDVGFRSLLCTPSNSMKK